MSSAASPAPSPVEPTPLPPPDAPGPAPSDDQETRIAREWIANVYQGDHAKQLTVRAVITGMLIGGIMSVTNLYIGLKTGWGLGVTITACILAYAIFSSLQTVIPRLREDHFTILENNMMSSAASAAGYMSSSIFVGAVPALYLAAGKAAGWLELALWAAAVSFLGVFMAIPMKRQQINIEQLPFPSGIATAETLKAMHTTGVEAKLKAMALGWSGLIGAVIGFLREMHAKWMPINLPGTVWFSGKIGGQPLQNLTIGFEPSLIMIGAGAIIGIRVGVSLLVSAIVCYAVLGPYVLNEGWVPATKYRQQWALWPGVGMLVTSGLTAFFLKWGMIARAFANVGQLLSGKGRADDDPLRNIEAPQSWFVWGTLASGAACVVLGMIYFEIAWWMGILAVVATFFLALVASRATGETDITPTGAMGKITQLIYGVLAPGNMTTNLMTASITGGAAIHSADLLTDLKSGYLLGANPRKQLIAQLWGVLAGTAFVVPAYLLILKPEEIGGDRWPAPAAQIWAGVAKVLAVGISSLPAGAAEGMLYGGLAGIVLALFEEYTPRRYRKYTLSSTAVGIAWVIPAFNSISMFLGALIAWVFQRASRKNAERYNVAVASGFIAGESLIAIVVIVLGIWLGGGGH